jgi:CubicO group peptidase (beta-lactamase class C family)
MAFCARFTNVFSLAACASLALGVLAGCEGDDAAPSFDAALPDAGSPVDAGPDLGPPADLDGFLAYEMRVGGIRGLAAAIVQDGVVARVYTRGMASETAAVDEHTLFVTASLSKTFVGALLLELAEEGRLDLDAPLDDVLGFPVRNPAFPDVPLTTRLLMTHTSGLVDDFGTLAGYTVIDGADPTMTLDEVARTYLSVPAHYDAEPGTSFSYCNAGFAVLGRVAEVASGEDLRALSEARLFAPLGLDGAGWFYADVDPLRLATEYTWNSRSDVYTPQPQRNYAHYPATSLRISVTGLARWLLVYTGGGTLDGVQVLSADSIAATRTIAYPAVRSNQSLVWYYTTQGGRTWLGHSGSSIGASNQLLYDPATGRGIVVLTNSDAYIRERLGHTEGADAIDAIVGRLDAEANAL